MNDFDFGGGLDLFIIGKEQEGHKEGRENTMSIQTHFWVKWLPYTI
jgi:hypothetical protein